MTQKGLPRRFWAVRFTREKDGNVQTSLLFLQSEKVKITKKKSFLVLERLTSFLCTLPEKASNVSKFVHVLLSASSVSLSAPEGTNIGLAKVPA